MLQLVAGARSRVREEAPSSAPITHSATGRSRLPRALQSVAPGGTRSSTQSVPAEIVCTTATRVSPGSASSVALSPCDGIEEVDRLEVEVVVEQDHLDAGRGDFAQALEGALANGDAGLLGCRRRAHGGHSYPASHVSQTITHNG